MKTLDDINRVLIAGAGTLGMRITLRCALDGYRVTMFDINTEQLKTAQSMQTHIAAKLLKDGAVTKAQVELAEQNIIVSSDLDEAVIGVDLVSESIVEDLDIKLAFYRDLTPKLESGTIVTTNTSFLLPSQLVSAMTQPENFCALHFHDVFTQTVLDVMPHSKTSQQTVDLLMAFGKRINHVPVYIQKENNGYMFNAMFGEILAKAGEMYVNGVGSIQDIDRSWMGNFHTPSGPFGMLDLIGLDTAWHIMAKNMRPEVKAFADELKRRVDAGKLGYKTGEGFYTYPRPEYMQPDFLMGESCKEDSPTLVDSSECSKPQPIPS